MKIDYMKMKDESITLNHEEMELLKDKIMYYVDEFGLLKRANFNRSSYGLKHSFEDLLGFYVSNMDFKEAMKQLRIPHSERHGLMNVHYPISQKAYRQIEKDRRMLKNYGLE